MPLNWYLWIAVFPVLTVWQRKRSKIRQTSFFCHLLNILWCFLLSLDLHGFCKSLEASSVSWGFPRDRMPVLSLHPPTPCSHSCVLNTGVGRGTPKEARKQGKVQAATTNPPTLHPSAVFLLLNTATPHLKSYLLMTTGTYDQFSSTKNPISQSCLIPTFC